MPPTPGATHPRCKATRRKGGWAGGSSGRMGAAGLTLPQSITSTRSSASPMAFGFHGISAPKSKLVTNQMNNIYHVIMNN